MTLSNNNTSTTPCPECGEPMPMVTWVGAKPKCRACQRKGDSRPNYVFNIDGSISKL